MTPWQKRPKEEAALLNPAFCGVLLHETVRGYGSQRTAGMPYPLAFLVLPLVLHRATREALPRTTRTSLAVWLDENPTVRVGFAPRTKSLVPFTRESLLFGTTHGMLRAVGENLQSAKQLRRRATFKREHATDEVSFCMSRAEFLGKWLARAGKPGTIFALWGIRP